MYCDGVIRPRRHRNLVHLCSSPLQIVSRWWADIRRKRIKDHTQREETLPQLGRRTSLASISANRFSNFRDDKSFSLGIGCVLLYLIVEGKNEIAKMVQLRAEMETLLRSVREEMGRKDRLLKHLKLNHNLSCSVSDVQQGSNSNDQLSVQSRTSYAPPPISKCNVLHSGQEVCAGGIGELEVELEAELERLQLHLDGESALTHPEMEDFKVPLRDPSATIFSASFDEVIDPWEESEESYKVSPVELERRLHELLEARQQEQIIELESALECAQQKLFEKEMEVSWWKDTARLMSRHIPETSKPTCQLSSSNEIN